MDAPKRWHPSDLWVAIGYAIAVAVWMWLLSRTAGCLYGAPLPFPKPPPPFPGNYALTWHGAQYKATFLPDGTYLLYCGGRQSYVGTWRIKDGTLYVEEWQTGESPAASPYCWQTRADGKPGGFPHIYFRRLP